jgi:SP family myo-inositol transporter-like MFS transporter 13
MPIYLSEVSPKESRGMLSSLIGFCYAGGVVAALCSNIGFSKFLLGWRVSTSIQALLGLLFSLGMIWMPHTPRSAIAIAVVCCHQYIAM